MNDMTTPKKLRRRTAGAAQADAATVMRDILMAQALSLQAMFAELVEDAANSRPYVDSTAVYTRLALRAQSNCRSSLEALAQADRAAQR